MSVPDEVRRDAEKTGELVRKKLMEIMDLQADIEGGVGQAVIRLPRKIGVIVNASGGIATFNNLVLTTGGTYILTATSTGLSNAASTSVTVASTPAACSPPMTEIRALGHIQSCRGSNARPHMP